MDIKSRTYLFVKHKGLTMKKFEELCGLSSCYVSSMRKGFGRGKLDNVLTAFPDLNREWLLNGGRVEYLRAKTGSPVSVKVEPEAMAIIEKYRGKSTLVDIADRHNSHQSHIAITNYSLRAIKDDRGLKMFPGISTYWARHTWGRLPLNSIFRRRPLLMLSPIVPAL